MLLRQHLGQLSNFQRCVIFTLFKKWRNSLLFSVLTLWLFGSYVPDFSVIIQLLYITGHLSTLSVVFSVGGIFSAYLFLVNCLSFCLATLIATAKSISCLLVDRLFRRVGLLNWRSIKHGVGFGYTAPANNNSPFNRKGTCQQELLQRKVFDKHKFWSLMSSIVNIRKTYECFIRRQKNISYIVSSLCWINYWLCERRKGFI